MSKKTAKPSMQPVHYSRREYAEYLLTEEWALLRAQTLRDPEQQCAFCQVQRATQVHHLAYRNIVDVNRRDLCAVCGTCHEKIHALVRAGKISLAGHASAKVLYLATKDALKAPAAPRGKQSIGEELSRKITNSAYARRIYGLLRFTPRTQLELEKFRVTSSLLSKVKSWLNESDYYSQPQHGKRSFALRHAA